jgi:cell division protease FtsH
MSKSKKKIKFRFSATTVFTIIFLILFLSSLFNSAQDYLDQNLPEKSISTILQEVKADKIKELEITDNNILVKYKNGKFSRTSMEDGVSLFEILKDSNIDPLSVKITNKNNDQAGMVANFLINILPTILMVVFFVFLFRQARGAQDSIFSFGQSRAKRFIKSKSKITFKDVAGIKEAKEELEEVVDFLKHPEKYRKVGARTPKGVLLVGPAGCGKTLLAKAVAGEANVPFFSIAGSEFMEMLVGIGAARVRDLFKNAKTNAPAIIFIDEIDAIGRVRAGNIMSSHDEREQTLNQILVEMDGFEPTEKVVVIAATNRGDLLDPALLRPGRFDRRITVNFPDLEEREAILKLHSHGKPFENNVDWKRLAKRTVGYSGADLENMLNEAAILTARQGKDKIDSAILEEAATKVKLGPEKRKMQSEEDRKLTAYHEAGHAVVAYSLPNMDPVHRISIVARGMSLGHTLIPPKKEIIHETKTRLLERITSMLGGRAAEELIFKEVTTGAANDFNQATAIAREMVTEYGMSELGPLSLGGDIDITNWQKYYDRENISQETLAKIDRAISEILNRCYSDAQQILKKNKAKLDRVAQVLVEKENLDQDEFEAIMKA